MTTTLIKEKEMRKEKKNGGPREVHTFLRPQVLERIDRAIKRSCACFVCPVVQIIERSKHTLLLSLLRSLHVSLGTEIFVEGKKQA